jgi:hypothetical protein
MARKASELCPKCRIIYDSWSDVAPETARAIKRATGTKDLYAFFRRQQDAVLEACNHQEEVSL